MPSWKQTTYEMVAEELHAMFRKSDEYALACRLADRFGEDNSR
ncbi:hypothetical protein LCGC14_2328520, partial [marine sediment metagenome]